jgi:hypothetical protein
MLGDAYGVAYCRLKRDGALFRRVTSGVPSFLIKIVTVETSTAPRNCTLVDNEASAFATETKLNAVRPREALF